MALLVWVSYLVPLSAAGSVQSDEASYLKRKWAVDLSDPTTGLDNRTISKRLPGLVDAWSRTNGWTEHKAKDIRGLHPVQDVIRAHESVIRRQRLSGVTTGRSGFWWTHLDFDHAAPDWDEVLALGFPGMARRLEANWKDDEYHRTRKQAAEASLRLLDRLVAQGERNARRRTLSDVRRERLERQIASLRRLRTGAPLTALDAMNFIYLYWVMSEEFESIQVRTLGNLDRLLTPYYRADVAVGRTTEAEFREQFRHFWWQWGSMDYYWGQPTYFGGTRADGTTEYTEVSRMMFEEIDALALPTPKMHVKIGRSTPDWVWRQTLDMMRRQRSLSFIGEESHWRVIRSMGYSQEQARTFLLWGCYEWALKDGANDTFAGAANLVKPIECLFAEAKKGTFAAESFETFFAAYLNRIANTAAAARTAAVEMEKYLGEVNPSLMFSLSDGNSVKTGIDAYCGGKRTGNNSGIWAIGLGSAVDSLMAVKELVYDRAELSLAEFGTILSDDWRGHEELQRRISRSRTKWGNGGADVSAIAQRVVKGFSSEINRFPNSRGGVFKTVGHSGRCHYGFGAATGATPDGRRAGEELSKNVSPTMGADVEGATALVNSVTSLDAVDLPGDFPLDVALLPASVAGDRGRAALKTLIERYFAGGGLVIQFNIVDASTLRDAQKHPERYENLQVRVCGWNVRWNDIPAIEQEKFILRQAAQEDAGTHGFLNPDARHGSCAKSFFTQSGDAAGVGRSVRTSCEP